MKSNLLANLTEEQKVEMRSSFGASRFYRDRLTEILTKKVVSARANARSKNGYEVSNWAYLQADAIGYERALFEVMELLNDEGAKADEPLGEAIETRPKRRPGRPKKIIST